MNNKLCVITGANSGIGFETVKALADEGAFIVMVCRNEEKAAAARTEIANDTGNQGIDIVLCDFSVQSEIRRAAGEILERYDQVDLLINNHGFIASKREESVDGYEMTFAVNHLGYVLFTDLLMGALKKAAGARIINVSSEAHRRGNFDPDNLQLKDGFTPMKAYSNSKLFNILFTKKLAKYLTDNQTHVTTNSLHPGVVASNFAQSGNFLTKTFFTLGQIFMKSPKEGAETSIYLATSPEVEGVNGAYFKDKKAVSPSAEALNEEAANRLWEISREMCGL